MISEIRETASTVTEEVGVGERHRQVMSSQGLKAHERPGTDPYYLLLLFLLLLLLLSIRMYVSAVSDLSAVMFPFCAELRSICGMWTVDGNCPTEVLLVMM